MLAVPSAAWFNSSMVQFSIPAQGRFVSLLKQGDDRQPCPSWVMGGKTLSEYMFSEYPQIADIVGAPIARLKISSRRSDPSGSWSCLPLCSDAPLSASPVTCLSLPSNLNPARGR